MKWIIGIGLVVLLGAGVFFYWADNSETVAKTQSETVESVQKPLVDAQDATELAENKDAETEEKVNEAING